jgi:hypothetical protein
VFLPVVEIGDVILLIGKLALAELHPGSGVGSVFALGKIFHHIAKLLQGFLRHGLIPVDGGHLFEMAHPDLVDGVRDLRMNGMEFLKVFILDDGLGVVLVEIKGIGQSEFSHGV